MIYDGPVTYTGSPSSEPSAYATTFVDWGAGDFGSVERTVAPLALERWTTEHPGRQGTTIRYLQCCAVGPNPTLDVAQVQDSTGAVWNYATVSTDTDRSVVLDERSTRGLTHIAVVLKLSPGSPPQVLLITAPDVTEVAYARNGTDFVSQQRDQSSPARAGARAPAVYGFLRTGDPQLDRLRIDTGSPTPTYEGPVD